MAQQGRTFRAARPVSATAIVELLRRRFRLQVEAAHNQDLTYYDTFDARLHVNRLTLAHSAGELRLASLDGQPLYSERQKSAPSFAQSLADGPLRDALVAAAGIRRLLPLVTVNSVIYPLRVLDGDDKTVVRLQLEQGHARLPRSARDQGTPLRALIHVLPVKGYEEELASVIEALEQAPELARESVDAVVAAIEASGGRLVENPCKLRPELDPATAAGEAMRRIHRKLLEIVRLNEDGVRAATDSEFLHDYRVTVRRIRSALSQVKAVFAAERVAHFAAEFKWLAAATGPARDADVFLLKLPDYRATLPEKTRRDLDPLEVFLKKRQRRAYRNLRKTLASERYARLMADWETFLSESDQAPGNVSNAARPLGAVASERIAKTARRVLKNGSAIDDDTPAAALHALRLRCKKLRYLLDLFAGLYDADAIAKLLRDLKKLQDNLGDFNDCEVQQDTLQSFATEMAAAGETPVETFLAMGRLEDRLQIGQERARHKFSRRFERFASSANRRLIRQIFTSGSQ